MQSSPEQQGFPLPANPFPPDTVCYQIEVPNDPAYIQAFYGVLYDLTLWLSWQRDSAHTGRLAAMRMKEMWLSVVTNPNNCQSIEQLIEESEYEMSLCEQLRFHDGKLQALCCGVWTDIEGQPDQGVTGGSQPGPGTPQPQPGGGCLTYQGETGAAAPWYVPTVVNTGDVITLEGAKGAWNDGAVATWNCFDGSIFFAGKNTGIKTFSGSDPLPSAPHMTMLAVINGVYYDIAAGPVTVPSGIVSQPVTIQPNNAVLAGGAGTLQFALQVCNNQEVEWTHTFDLSTNAAPFVPFVDSFLGTDYGAWTPGTGFTPVSFSSHGFGYRMDGFQWSGSAFHMTALTVLYHLTPGTNNSGGNPGGGLGDNIGLLLGVPWSSWAGDNSPALTWSGSHTGVNFFNCVIGVSNVNGGPPDGGSADIYQVIVSGKGFDPFV